MAQIKYLDFGSLYTYCCHGNKRHHMSRWIRERLAYVDSMLDYFVSQDDQVTIRMNKTGLVTFDVTTYIPLYFNVKWNNSAMGIQRIKMNRGETKTFSFNSTVATDQELIIYHAQHIKRLDNLSNLNPSSCILSNAIKLNEVEIHSTELYNINVTNNKYLRRVDLSNCPKLGTVTATGSSLDLSNCKYLKYCDVRNTALTEIQLNTSGGSLKEIYYPKTIQSIELIKQRLLETVGLPYGENGEDIPTALYNIDIEECPMINRLNMSEDDTINNTFASMVYCNNLTLRNALDLQEISFDGFHRLRNVAIENMYNLEELGFNDLLPVGRGSTLKYVALSNCPKLEEIELNCTSDDYEITLANNAVLDFGRLYNLKNITSNCVLKGLKTLVVPNGLEGMFFTNEYGSGYSSIENIWSSSVCSVSLNGSVVSATHMNSGYKGIDFLGMNLKNIDLGALVNIPKAINFSLSPTHVNPNFNLNRDGQTYPYLQPVGILDLSNYTGSLAKFFNGVDLDKLAIICNNDLPQNDLSYCFYNSTFSSTENINTLLSRVSNISNLDYCFYKTTISDLSVLENINMEANSTMNYAFAECPNITELRNVVIPASVVEAEGLFSKCSVALITNMNVYVNGSIDGLFKGCNKLETINTLRIPNAISMNELFMNCTRLTHDIFISSHVTNCSNAFKDCTSMTHIHSNWNNVYDNEITPTGCYSGCTAITHIDDENVIIYDGDMGLDYVPVEWGGMGLSASEDITSIFELTIPSDNTEVKLYNYGYSFSRRANPITSIATTNFINWGDGQIYSTADGIEGASDFPSHVYARAGTYIIKGTIGNFGAEDNNEPQGMNPNPYVTKILKLASAIYDTYYKEYKHISRINNACKGLINLTSVSGIEVTNIVTDLKGIFSGCTSLTSVNTEDWDTSNVSSMQEAFKGCSSLTSLDLSSWDVKNVTTMYGMFQNCKSLTSLNLDGWNTESLTTMGHAFRNCSLLQNLDVSHFKTENVKSFAYAFDGCKLLTDFNFLNNWDIGMATDISYMLQNTGTTGAFTLNWDLSNVVNTSNFLNGTKITDLNLRLTSNKTNIGFSGFACSSKLANWDGVDISIISKKNPNNWIYLFPYLYPSEYENNGNINIKFYGTITRDMDIWGFLTYTEDRGILKALSVNSIVNLLELLEDYTGQDTATLQLGSYTIGRLSVEQIRIATDKNWTLV